MKLALLRKDLRVLRLPLVGGLVLAVLPYALYAGPRAAQWWQDRHNTLSRAYYQDGVLVHRERPPAEWADSNFFNLALFPAALAGLGLLALTAAACGGVAFAAERRDRSAEFLAMLPVSRGRAAGRKLLAAAACLLLPAAVHVTVFALGWREMTRTGEPISVYELKFFTGALNCAALTLMMFGLAWLLSSFFESPAVAASAAVGVAAVTVYLIAQAGWLAETADPMKAVHWVPSEYVTGVLWRPGVFGFAPPTVHDAVRAVAVLTGLSALLAGGLVYARRVRP